MPDPASVPSIRVPRTRPDEATPGIDADLDKLRRDTFAYFVHETNPVKGLAIDKTAAIDYFENSRRATYVQRQYAIDNPLGFKDYGPHCWGITASDGPGPNTVAIDGIGRLFFDYVARGASRGASRHPAKNAKVELSG